MEEKISCEVCEHFADKKNRPTPCQECLPELMPENYEAWHIYTIISGQLIMGQAGPIDIDHNALHRAMDLYGVEDKRDCFERVCTVARHMLQVTWEKRKAKTA